MTAIARAFVAVVPPPEVLDAVESALAPIRPVAPPRLSWTRRQQWHLTLQFLGRVDDADAVVRALGASVRGRGPVAVGLGTSGAFPSASRASVLWIGLDRGGDELADLARTLHQATGALGYEAETRAFTPHLTVARARSPRPVGSLLASLGDGPFGPVWDATEVVLMESDTRPDGAVHREVAHFPLAAR